MQRCRGDQRSDCCTIYDAITTTFLAVTRCFRPHESCRGEPISLFSFGAVGAAKSLDVHAANKLPDLLNIHLRQKRQLIKSLLKFSRRWRIFLLVLPPTSDRLRNKRSFVRCDTNFLLLRSPLLTTQPADYIKTNKKRVFCSSLLPFSRRFFRRFISCIS